MHECGNGAGYIFRFICCNGRFPRKWLEFWNQPGLRELMDIRRGHEPLPEYVGYWKERPQ